MILIIFQGSLCYRFYLTKFEQHMLGNDKSLEPGEPKRDRSKEKRVSKGRVLTVEEAILRPEKDQSKEKKTSKGYAGTAQDIEWYTLEEPDDCGREDVYHWNRVQGEYEN